MLQRIVFLDLETTGGSTAYDRIIEIGLIAVEDGRVVDEWSTLVNPGRRIPHGIQTLTGISDAMVEAAPPFAEVAPGLARRLDGKVLAAHNARFDYGFLRQEFARAGVRYRAPVLCTVKLSRQLHPQHPRHNLDALLVRYGLFCIDRHRALGDARVLWELAQIWHREFGPERVQMLCAELVRPPPVPPHLPPDFFDDLPESRGVYILYGDGDAALYVGRGANIRSSVVARFAQAESGRARDLAAQVRRVDFVESAGEFGACMKEAELVRKLAPAYNRTRAQAQACTWLWRPETPGAAPQLVPASARALEAQADCFGVFRTRAAARAALRELARTHALCPAVLGLEPRSQGEPCTARAGGGCRGACVGAENPLAHGMRLAQALARLRVRPWPYGGPIAVRERAPGSHRAELHVLDRFRYLGTAHSEAELYALAETRAEDGFDVDTYRAVARLLKSVPPTCEIVPLGGRAAALAARLRA